MSVRFVLGPAGTGKTHYCTSSIATSLVHDPLGAPQLYLVPQQATFIHERALAEKAPGGGFCTVTVSGFARLALRAYQHAHLEPPLMLSDAGRLLLMRGVLQRHRTSLVVFGAAARRVGLASQLVSTAEEMQTYGVKPDHLYEAAQELAVRQPNSHLADKLKDIALLYRDYTTAQDNDWGSYSARMELLTQEIGRGMLNDTRVFIDGFSEFTPAELNVVAALMQYCPQVTICLALDADAAGRVLDEDEVFYPTWQTYGRLRELAEQHKVEILPPLILSRGSGRFTEQPELDALEKMLAGTRSTAWLEAPQQITLTRTLNRRDELCAVGREIKRLVREEGLRFRDISVITRDSQPYIHLLPAVFGEMNIPYFVDRKKPLIFHPLLDLVRALLEIWAFRPHYRNVMRLIKNGLSPLAGADADELDNYCLAHGVRFYHWNKPTWTFTPREGEDDVLLSRINTLRERVAVPMNRFLDALGTQATADQLNAALIDFLREWQVEERLYEWSKQQMEAGKGEQSAANTQAWDKLNRFFAEAVKLLDGVEFTPPEMVELYDEALAGLTFSTIPPGLDQVLVASLERSRNPEIKAAFVLGLNDGIMPRRIAPDSIFRDDERKTLSDLGLSLAADTLTRQFGENYLCYIALTRSSKWMALSYLSYDDDGKELLPSPLLRKVKELFPRLPEKIALVDDASHLVGGTLDLELAATKLADDWSPLWQAVYTHYQQMAEFSPSLTLLQCGLCFQPEQGRLSAAILTQMHGRTLHGSVSRLEKFRLCPFSYFATYGLRLKSRPEFELTPANRGDLYHFVLAEVGHTLAERQISWRDIDEQLAGLLVDSALENILPCFLSGIMSSSARYQYLQERIRAALVKAVMITAEHMKRGQFVPVAFELPFGRDTTGLPAFSVMLDDGRELKLSGQIDRVDMAESDDGTAYFRVIDYKTGNVNLDCSDIAAGLRLQLLVYLQVVLANSNTFTFRPARPAGMYYAPLRDSSWIADDRMAAARKNGNLRLNGLTVADGSAVMLADPEISGYSELIPVGYNPDKDMFYSRPYAITAEKLNQLQEQLIASLKQSAAAMLDGLISVSPLVDTKHDACAFCDFAAVCGLDREAVTPRGITPDTENEENEEAE